MNKTCVIYGSSTGTCEDIAKRIGAKLGLSDDAIIDVANLKAEDVADCQNLLLGTSTWGAGELQDDWYDGLKTLQGADLNGKTVAIFGCVMPRAIPILSAAAWLKSTMAWPTRV